MSDSLWEELVAFLKLSQAFQQRKMIPDRDRAFVLAGCCAALCNFSSISAYCRSQILQNNRGHMVSKWPDLKTAMENTAFQVFLKQLARRLPLERVEAQLLELGYCNSLTLAEFPSEEEFLARLLDLDPTWLEDNFS
ncbi:MAG: hypothetical protein ABL888_12795 [Pirellulaceae bacterium]